MQTHAIIVELLNSANFKKCVAKVNPSDLREDLVSEVSLILLETNPEKIIALHQRNQLTFYVVRIIMNLAFSNTSPFYKKFRSQQFVEFRNNFEFDFYDEEGNLQSVKTHLLIGVDDSADNIKQKEQEEQVLKALDKIEGYGSTMDEYGLDEYESQMVKLYVKYGTFRNMQKELHIPYVSCFNTVIKAIEKIKKKVYDNSN